MSAGERPVVAGQGRVAGEVALSALVVLACVIAVWGSRGWPTGARLFPTLFGMLVGAVALGNVVASVTTHIRRSSSAHDEDDAPTEEEADEGTALSGVSTFMWIAAFPVAGVVLGFLVAVPLLTLAFARLGARESWLWSLVSAVVMTALVWFVTGVMGLRVPTGVFAL